MADRTKATARWRASIDAAIEQKRAPGVQYVVVGRGGTVFEGAAGWADLAARVALEPSTTMMMYSMTKTVTAVAVLQLVEERVLFLDAPVRSLLPEIPYGDRLTLRHLLAQTSGIPNPIPLRWVHLPEEDPTYDERAMLRRRLAESPALRFEPGERYAYSNLSYWLLGRAIEAGSGLPYAEYVRRKVFARLGLASSEAGFTIPDPRHHASGYLPRWSILNLLKSCLMDRRFVGEVQGPWVEVKASYLDGAAFGGVVASARAMGRFLEDQLAPRSVLLGESGRRLFYEQQRNNAGKPIGMTLGWHIGARGEGCFFKE
ncbi:MAG TPA: serine hydrolase domain-containing protein, partial [Anaeromyxobacter sp.]|nr:serine hydrolase domain-containing protein [Anaeromyxobacter sp.]